MSIQCGILWGCGKEAFGITPPNPLRVLVIQGEDDEGDVIEMARMIWALDLSDEESALVEMNTLVGRKNATGRAFIKFLEEAAADFKPDLVILNPLNNYIGSDDKDARAWVEFRDKLYRVMKEHDFGMLLFHHTPKTNFQSTSNFATQDWQYRGAGAAGITNSIRASIIMDPVPGKENVGTYRFIGAKRGGRCGAGWTRGESGCHERFFKHTTEPGLLMWEDVEPVVREAKKAVDVNALMDKILALVPKDGMKGKADIEMEARQTFGAGRDQVRQCLRALQERGLIFTWKLPKHLASFHHSGLTILTAPGPLIHRRRPGKTCTGVLIRRPNGPKAQGTEKPLVHRTIGPSDQWKQSSNGTPVHLGEFPLDH